MMTGFERYTKKTRREMFLEEMEQVMPWAELCVLIEPHYPKQGNGRPPVGLEQMLRIYFLQHWFNLSDPAVEEALYDSAGAAAVCGHRSGPRAGAGRDDDLELPSFAGRARSVRSHAGRSTCTWKPRDPHRHGHDRGRDHHSCALVDQERDRQARPGDASDAQGQASGTSG